MFKLESEYKPTGDQPEAINELVKGLEQKTKFQTLKGVTGSGKTFTIANVIEKVNKPTLVLAHNKTLAAQLYAEFKEYFPSNSVEYFVSYYDYYQPEAYLPVSGTYIEKDLSINENIEKLRLSTTSSLLSGKRDVIVIASVSCLYGIGNPVEFKKNIIEIEKNQILSRTKFLHNLVQSLYSRTTTELVSGAFKVSGDIIDIFPSYADHGFKIHFFGDEIELIEIFDPNTKKTLQSLDKLNIYPANMFATSPDVLQNAMNEIRFDLKNQIEYFKEIGKFLEAKRLEERTNFDLEMIQELGYCSGGDGNELDLWISADLGFMGLTLTNYSFPGGDGTYGAGTGVFDGDLEISGSASLGGVDLTVGYFTDLEALYIEAAFSAGPVDIGLGFGSDGKDAFYAGGDSGLVNMSFGGSKEIKITEEYSLPVFGSFIYNPDSEAAFLVFGMSF